MQTTRTPYSISFMATVLLLLLFACHSTVANAAVALGCWQNGSRLCFS